jgi:hypothetical protein
LNGDVTGACRCYSDRCAGSSTERHVASNRYRLFRDQGALNRCRCAVRDRTGACQSSRTPNVESSRTDGRATIEVQQTRATLSTSVAADGQRGTSTEDGIGTGYRNCTVCPDTEANISERAVCHVAAIGDG